MTGVTTQALGLSLACVHQSKSELKDSKLGDVLPKQPSHPYVGSPKMSTAFQARLITRKRVRQGNACGKIWDVNPKIIIQT